MWTETVAYQAGGIRRGHGGIGFHFTVSIHACGCSKILLAASGHFFQSLLRSWNCVSGVNYGQISSLLMHSGPTESISLSVQMQTTAFVDLEIGDFYGQRF
jgi:hypothetical protein